MIIFLMREAINLQDLEMTNTNKIECKVL